MPRTARVSLLAIACLILFGCATLPPNAKRDPRDPFERMNRTTYRFNDAFDKGFARPVARGYQKVVPQPVRTGVSNFLDNLGSPVTIANDLLQLKFKDFGTDLGRLVMNSTIGIGGIFDPASSAGLEKNEKDLGLTFGHWGAKPGPYLVVPFFGPSDVRDGLGQVGDIWLDPRHYIKNNAVSYGLWGLGAIDLRYRLLPTDQALDSAFDPYAFMRNAFLQRRQFLLDQGKGAQQKDDQQYQEEEKLLEQSGDDTKPPPDTVKP